MGQKGRSPISRCELKQETLVLTRSTFAAIDLEKMAQIRSRILGVMNSTPGFISNTLWERVEDPFSFLSIGHFSNLEDSILAWENLLKSPVMEVILDLMVEPSNTQRFIVKSKDGLGMEETVLGHFCSVSYRLADIGYGPSVIQELEGIFAELKMIPGFLGYAIGQLTDIEEEILGLAFWESRAAFEASIPKKSLYQINLFSRTL